MSTISLVIIIAGAAATLLFTLGFLRGLKSAIAGRNQPAPVRRQAEPGVPRQIRECVGGPRREGGNDPIGDLEAQTQHHAPIFVQSSPRRAAARMVRTFWVESSRSSLTMT